MMVALFLFGFKTQMLPRAKLKLINNGINPDAIQAGLSKKRLFVDTRKT